MVNIDSKESLSWLLLTLVRSSLWETPVDCEPFKGKDIDWDEIAEISMQQTVGALAMTAAISLPPDLRPSKDWQHKAWKFIERNRRTHLLIEDCIATATDKMKEAAIRSVLLKGEAYARCYPDATLRLCGDIDLYVGENNYYAAYKASQIYGWESHEQLLPSAKHYGCYIKGIRIELHRIAGQFPTHSINLKFQEWSSKQLRSEGGYFYVGNSVVSIPTPLFDVVFCFMHLYLHFIQGGIGLRHICDWVMLLHSHHKAIDYTELENILKEFRLFKAWQLFTPIAVDYLGLQKEECPFYSAKNHIITDKIFSLIIKEGNFGRNDSDGSQRPEGYLRGKLYSFRQLNKKMRTRIGIDPDNILRYYISYVKKSIKVVVKDLITRKGE